MKALYFILISLLGLLLILAGCQVARGFWHGVNDVTEQQKAQQLMDQINQTIETTKQTGTVDMAKFLQILEAMKAFSATATDNKMGLLEFFGYIMGISVASYLGTRKLRLVLTDMIRNHK